MLTDEQKETISQRLDEIALLDTEAEIGAALGALIVEMESPPGLTISKLEKDLSRRRKVQVLSSQQRADEFNRIAHLPSVERPGENAALRPKIGPGWTIQKIEKEVQACVPPMKMDEVDAVCVAIAQSDPTVRSGKINALIAVAKARNLVLDRKELRAKVERVVANLAGNNVEGRLLVGGDHANNADLFLEESHKHAEGCTLRYILGAWYRWTGPKWVSMKEEDLGIALRLWAEEKHILNGDQVSEKFKPNNVFIIEMINAVRARTAWAIQQIDGITWEGNPPFNGPALHVANGILNIKTGKLYDHTPRCFNTTSAQADWNGIRSIDKAPWGQFIKSIASKDSDEQMSLLQEFFGYSMTGLTHMQKGLMLIGPKRSGKGTILRTFSHLMGPQSIHSMPTEQFGKNFPLMGAEKAAIIAMPDIRTDKETRFGPVAETMLTTIGEDMVTIQRKYADPWIGRLLAKWWGVANSIPQLRDPDGVLASRFVYCELTESFFGKEDTGLESRLKTDLDSVLIWGVQGLRRLLREGKFTETSRGKKMAKLSAIRQDPVGAFINEHMEPVNEHREKKDLIFVAFVIWAKQYFLEGFTKAGLVTQIIRKEIEGVSSKTVGKGEHRLHCIEGLKFKDYKRPTWRQAEEVWSEYKDDNNISDKAMEQIVKELKMDKEEAESKVVDLGSQGHRVSEYENPKSGSEAGESVSTGIQQEDQ